MLISHTVPELLLLPVYTIFIGRHCYYRLSADIDNVETSSTESAMTENVGVAVEISLLTHSVPEIPKYTENFHLE